MGELYQSVIFTTMQPGNGQCLRCSTAWPSMRQSGADIIAVSSPELGHRQTMSFHSSGTLIF